MARGLSTGRISLRVGGGVVFKEIRIALLLGFIFGALLGLGAILLMGLGRIQGLAVGLSLWLSMGLASVLGAVLPMLLKTVHIDPAVATNPFVTTSVDLLGLLSFFVVAGPHLADR
jgi:magnesium transporter